MRSWLQEGIRGVYSGEQNSPEKGDGESDPPMSKGQKTSQLGPTPETVHVVGAIGIVWLFEMGRM
jgi:hypothetical protein